MYPLTDIFFFYPFYFSYLEITIMIVMVWDLWIYEIPENLFFVVRK